MNLPCFYRLILITFCIILLQLGICGQVIKVTLLGTGAPAPVMNRFGPSILVEAGNQKLIFDVGRGAYQRLEQIKVKYKDINGVFLTHLHSDHLMGFPDLWLTGWHWGNRSTSLKVWGPKGTQRMMSHLEEAFDFDIKIRLYDDRALPEGITIEAKDIAEGVVYEKNGVRVTAFEVDHAPVKPAFGYRIDYAGHSVVLSGDTRFSENLIKYAQGTDLLIHEVVASELFRRIRNNDERSKTVIEHHTTAEQAAQIFSRVKPKLAVFSHIVPPNATDQDLIPTVRKTYSGAVELGEDLMVIEIGEKIEIHKPNALSIKSLNQK